MRAIKHILTAMALLLTVAAGRAENYWQRAVVNHSRQQYRSGNQNWQACQSREGWMYFANNKGLLEYDGANWTTYPLPGNAKVRAVWADGDTIYVGALGQFGRFTRNQKGRLCYERLSPPVDKAGQLNVWHIHRIGRDIYYQTDDGFYVNDSTTRLDCQTGVSYSAVVYNRLYTASSRGLTVLVGRRFELLKGIDPELAKTIVSILPWSQGRLLLVSSERGLHIYADQHAEPLHTPADALLQRVRLSSAALADRHLALGTMQDGLLLLNLQTGTTEHLTLASGLQNKTVLATTFDRDRNLWLGLDNGIDCIPLASPLRFLWQRLSPVGSGYCSIRFDGKVYLGTNQGLYEMTADQIRFIEGTGSQVLCLDTVGGRLFCGGRRFFLSIAPGGRITRYDNRGVWGVRSPGYRKDRLLTGSYWGLRLMHRQGDTWTMGEEVKGTSISAKTFYVEPQSGAVWVANKEKGLYRLTLSDDLTRVESQRCHNSPALPKGDNVSIALIDGETVIASRHGLFRYDSTHDRLERHTALEQRLGGKQTGDTQTSTGTSAPTAPTPYTYIYQDPTGRIWYATGGTLHIDDGKRHDSYLSDCLMEDFESVSLVEHYAVIGTEDGFASLNLNWRQTDSLQQRPDIRPYIRKVYVGNYADTLYYGCRQPITLAWADNDVRLEYSATNYDPTHDVLFSYRLEGSAEDWSPYTRRRIKEYTNLAEGDYTFRLRISSGDGKTEETQLRFTILPPWWRTWWAYTLYTLLAMLLLLAIYRRLQKSRQRLIEQKDEQIQEREEQIHEREEEIETLREEKLEIELRAKQDELVRTRMNIVRKNEMLQEIKKTAVSLNNSLGEENLPASKRRIVRLIGQIDVNMEHDDDLEAFRDSFDAVHHNFLQTLGERHPDLSHKERMLCAYIRMGLQSKEIAPLLNISTRGVEISRYRIRQKLGLDKSASLTEFLQHL